MPSTHRPISSATDAGVVSVDQAHLKLKGLKQTNDWSGTVGGFGNIVGIAFQNSRDEIELLFLAKPPDEKLGDICSAIHPDFITIIRPMIAQPNGAVADTKAWIPDSLTLTINHWELQQIVDGPFDGTVIVATADGAFVAYFRGMGQPVDVCAT